MSTTFAKTACPLTRAEFHDNAEPVTIKIGEQTIVADPREFSTGSLGHYANGKITMTIGGKPVRVQAQVTLSVVGSKDLPRE